MNFRLDTNPQPASRTPPDPHRHPPLAATRRHVLRSRTVLTALAAAVVVVPTALAVSGTSAAATTRTTSTSNAGTSCVNNVKGIPPKGTAYVGAAVGGTQSYDGLESKTGMRLRVHRTYFSARQVNAALRVVKADLAAGRLPWVSFKMPYSWAAMASGKGDAWARDLTNRLAVVGGPVWLAFHHEPEGDGPIQDWVRMQRHLIPIVHAHSSNIAYTAIFTSWNITYGSYPLTKVWPGTGVDILGVDIYNNYKVRSSRMLDPMHFIPIFKQWADSHNVRWAISESGYTQGAANVDPRWLDTMYNDSVANGAAAFTYFDSSANSVADWTLDTPSKMAAFTRILSQSTKIC
jgi:hypothetical protein